MKAIYITIKLEKEFETLAELIRFIANELKGNLKKFPIEPKLSMFREVSLSELTKEYVIYKVLYGQIQEPYGTYPKE